MRQSAVGYEKIQIQEWPFVSLGENEGPVNLFFFFSLSSRDVNSSSELVESSILEGAENMRLGVSRDLTVLQAGSGGPPVDFSKGFVNPFIGGTDTGGSLWNSKLW